MNTVRTTITLPEDLHEELKLLALKNKVTLSEVVESKISGRKIAKKKKKNTEEEIKKTIAFFRRIAKEGEQINAIEAIREARKERLEKLSKF